VLECEIVDLSAGGARAKLDELCLLPPKIWLFESHQLNIYECNVLCQDEEIVGLSFVDICSRSKRLALIEDCSLGLLEGDDDLQTAAPAAEESESAS